MKHKSPNEKRRRATDVKTSRLPFIGIIDKIHVADEFKVDRKTVEHWMRRGIIPYFKIGRTVRFDAEAVMNKLREKCQIGAR